MVNKLSEPWQCEKKESNTHQFFDEVALENTKYNVCTFLSWIWFTRETYTTTVNGNNLLKQYDTKRGFRQSVYFLYDFF